MYLAAAGQVGAEREVLSANFRSTDAVIDWVNGVFGNVIQPEPSVQPAYGPLDACRPGSRDHGTVHVLGATAHDDVDADAMRWLEAESVGVAVVTALRDQWPVGDGDGGLRPCRPDDIAVLLPARTSLPMLEATLSRLTIPYRAENSSVVYVTPEIRSLMLALRAAADPTDALALVAALRTPLYGCSDVELYEWKQAGGSWRSYARAPESMADHPVAAAIGHIASIARDIGRSTPAELLDRIVVERRMLETALGGRDARDVWRRVRYVVDQARAWTDAGGRGVRRYLRWAAYQAAEGRASDTILPERDHDAVRVMTVHAAKGLEFPITIVSGLTTKPQGQPALSVVWPDGGWMLAERDNDEFQAYKPLDEQMGDAERRRLLYVACTRAVDHLVVSLHRKEESVDGEQGTSKSTSATVLAVGGGLDHGARPLEGTVTPIKPTVADDLELPWSDHAEWEAERRRAITEASVRSATSATGLATAMAEAAAASDEGLQKDAVDLDLPPWQRGRYGTAIGRAVHAVLQDADLVTGSNIDELAAAQCAAEGIFGLEATRRCTEPIGARLRRSSWRPPRGPNTGASCSSSPSWVARSSRGTSTCSCAPPRASSSSTTRPTSGDRGPTRRRASPATATNSPPTAWCSAGCSTNRSSAASSCVAAPTSRPSRSRSTRGTWRPLGSEVGERRCKRRQRSRQVHCARPGRDGCAWRRASRAAPRRCRRRRWHP